MDRTEAIKRIVDHMRAHRMGEYPHIRLAEALTMAITALREQINYSEVQQESIKTNADRIRAMTDEELAELFRAIADGESCTTICDNYGKCCRNNAWEPICKNHYLKWLQQPAEEG